MENNNNNNNDKVFAKGLYFKLPHMNAQEWVKGKLSITVNEFVQFINDNQKNGYINIDLLVSKAGAPYAMLDTWEPNKQNNNTQATKPQQAPATNQPQHDNPSHIQSEANVDSEEEIKIENIPF